MTTIADRGTTIGVRLAKTADRQPDSLAVVENDTQITFRQLDAAATAIAAEILDVGQDRPGCVCLLFENKLPAIEAIFGAGRSGRPYVPLDAGDPEERLRFILHDSEPVVLLTEGTLRERARAIVPSGCALIDVERLQPRGEGRLLPDVASDAPLYLYYTSGSTGRPKGVIQTHGNLLFFADEYARSLKIGNGRSIVAAVHAELQRGEYGYLRWPPERRHALRVRPAARWHPATCGLA